MARQRVVLFGGQDRWTGRFSDTWEWDGKSWTQRSPKSSPTARRDHAMAYDLARQRVVLFGGTATTKLLTDTWEWDGSSWTQRSPTNTPPGTGPSQKMIYDLARRRVVLFDTATRLGLTDAWEWDGSNWTNRSPANGPSAQTGHTLAYDVSRGRVVLFGLLPGTLKSVSDTWEWDGGKWTQRAPTNSPKPRYDHAMAYDWTRKRVVVFGGLLWGYPFAIVSDTWEWDGNNWTQHSSTAKPSARAGHAMAYDITRRRVVLFGGKDLSNNLFSDTWEWDGSSWTKGSSIPQPSARHGHAMAYDVARQCFVLFGGGVNYGQFSDTWLYGRPATAQPFGTACSRSSRPLILRSERPYLGQPAFELEIIDARPASACVFGVSARRQDQPLPPCTFYLGSPIVPLLAVTNWFGFARSPRFAVPLSTNLRGLTLYAQALVADPQGPTLRMAFSAGLRLVLGD